MTGDTASRTPLPGARDPSAQAAASLRPATRTSSVPSSVIRDLLKVAQRPGMILMSGGLPAPSSFPVEALRDAFTAVLDADGPAALQYGMTEGEPGLRAWVAARETSLGTPTSADEVLITASSQQALDLVGKAFVEPGGPLLVESPTYLGAIQAFSVYGPEFRAIPTDPDGVEPEALTAEAAGDARLLYVMPTFQNPTGRTLSAPRREMLSRVLRRLDLWAIEDDPYGDLWYHEPPPPSLRTWAPERTIRICSFSKVLAPGLRLGYVVGPRLAIDLLARLKQATDLHTSTLTQRAVLHLLESGFLDRHLPRVRDIYAQQCAAILGALEAAMPSTVRWSRPAGGMFVWVELPDRMDAGRLLVRALERNVAFVPGAAFFASEPRSNTLRLAFATVPPDKLREGVTTLADLVRSGSRDSDALV
jgi:2-aminoadipate transaminase